MLGPKLARRPLFLSGVPYSFITNFRKGLCVDFTRKNGPDRWPDIYPPGFAGPIQYCLGMAWKIDGHWYASAPIEMWNERPEGGGPPQEYALNWFYNPA